MYQLSRTLRVVIFFAVAAGVSRVRAERETPSTDQVRRAMQAATEFFVSKVASHGGFVYYYSVDLQQRWGEGVATPDQIWIQPPGTPTVGMALLRAYEATGERTYLDAATDAARAVMHGQLRSGGWTHCVDFDPRGERVAQYRNGKGRGRDNSTLDDGISQAAIRLLMQVDRAHQFKNQEIHEAAMTALTALLAAQFPNGAFPQAWTGPSPRPAILRASFPSYDWRTEGRIKNYWDMYTLNDGVAGTVTDTLLDAHAIYQDPKYRAALVKLGQFLLIAQLPEPQPAWAQQYSHEMHPIWARRFEPPAVASHESQDVIAALMKISSATGDARYLTPIPRALEYLNRSQLADGQLARYYELQTNRPLYMNRQGQNYSLTYDDSNLPDHYGWKIEARVDELAAQYKSVSAGEGQATNRASAAQLAPRVRQILDELDEQGRWLSVYRGERLVGQPKFAPGMQYLASDRFSSNLATLSDYVLATRGR